jgi:hypothetical protein
VHHFFIALIVVLVLSLPVSLFGSILKIAPERLEVANLIYQFLIGKHFFTII